MTMTGSAGRKRTYAIWAVVILVMLALGVFTGGQLNDHIFESVQTKDSKGKVINILVMGIDARNARENSRSDTMILASLDPATNQVVMISIPRDTRIKNAKGQNDRINSINWLQGPEAACKEVGKLLNVDVDYYVVTNFGGFGDIVDALGGVHIDVETNMYHADPVNPELAINLKKGYQHLNGKQALAYVRYRGGPTADIGRTENQQKFIKALAKEMLQTKTILRLPQLIPELYENVHTNIPLQDMIYLGKMIQDLDMENIITLTLPGYFLSDSQTGASYWEADKKIASTLIEDLKSGWKSRWYKRLRPDQNRSKWWFARRPKLSRLQPTHLNPVMVMGSRTGMVNQAQPRMKKMTAPFLAREGMAPAAREPTLVKTSPPTLRMELTQTMGKAAKIRTADLQKFRPRL